MAVRTPRLPGLRFETQPPLPTFTLPRMDITAFVGFAAAGPIHRPVAIEDPAEFTNVFGQDLQLAWDPERGEAEYAYLGPAVRAFFQNGGRRCWVVRVADTQETLQRLHIAALRSAARANVFPVRGLIGLDLTTGSATQAAVVARSEGSWSDGVRVGAELSVEPTSTSLGPGDLTRITYADLGYVHYVVAGGLDAWFSTRVASDLAATAVSVRVFDGAADPPPIALAHCAVDASGAVQMDFEARDLPLPGALLETQFAGSPLQAAWLTVEDARFNGQLAHVSGTPLLWLRSAPPIPPQPGRIRSERLTQRLSAGLAFERWPGQRNTFLTGIDGLGFAPQHPRYWGKLPTDYDLYAPDEPQLLPPELVALRTEVGTPRFPLAGAADDSLLYLPLGVPQVLDPALRQAPAPSSDTELDRDGLTAFNAGLFIDADLADSGVLDLLEEADFLRYQQPQPRRLTGLHAVLGLGEPSLLTLPDAVHRGWARELHQPGAPIVQQASPLSPDDCAPPLPAENAPGEFAFCGALVAPVLFEISPPSAPTYMVAWSTIAGDDIQYALEESTANSFADSVVVYRGARTTQRLDGRAEGPYFYRVRAESTSTGQVSAWSNIVAVRSGGSFAWRVFSAGEFVRDSLETVHLAALRAGAASGDLEVLLSVPVHYREDDTIQHVSRLAAQLTFDRDRTLSFGALYHPWTIARDEALGALRRNPPDGTLAGSIAARATLRGAWVAPANEPFQGVLALEPALALERRLDLQEGHVNVLRQEADGFRVLCADTLSDDDDVRPLNVRRLMSLLRRLVLREGATYVFEPNDDAFRRLVERGFESLLDDLFTRGAFAGATPAQAFVVDASTTLNTPRDQDAGRMIVELKVAPSRPLSFLTIRLLQHGQRELTVVEG